jgi:hypothetical protein
VCDEGKTGRRGGGGYVSVCCFFLFFFIYKNRRTDRLARGFTTRKDVEMDAENGIVTAIDVGNSAIWLLRVENRREKSGGIGWIHSR